MFLGSGALLTTAFCALVEKILEGIDVQIRIDRIAFHRPRPVAKTNYQMLFRMGKRMNKWFGLD